MRAHNHPPFILSLSKDRFSVPGRERTVRGFNRLSPNGVWDTGLQAGLS
jgi:hypothetical protein